MRFKFKFVGNKQTINFAYTIDVLKALFVLSFCTRPPAPFPPAPSTTPAKLSLSLSMARRHNGHLSAGTGRQRGYCSSNAAF